MSNVINLPERKKIKKNETTHLRLLTRKLNVMQQHLLRSPFKDLGEAQKIRIELLNHIIRVQKLANNK